MTSFNHLARVWEVQGKACYLCGTAMVPAHRLDPCRGWSADHVRPRSAGFTRRANILVAHRQCNRGKGARAPTACELLLLETVNRSLGFKEFRDPALATAAFGQDAEERLEAKPGKAAREAGNAQPGAPHDQ